jgi:hypothetical protein
MRRILPISAALLAAVLPSCGGGGSSRSSPAGRQLLSAADFTYLGHYIVSGAIAADLGYGEGFTHRYVNGELRFLLQAYNGGHFLLIEAKAPSTLGATIDATTNRWADIWSPFSDGAGYHRSLWWDEEKARLWTAYAIDYPNDTEKDFTGAILIRTLEANGTISNLRGEFGLEGVGQRAIYGGIQRVPAWFRAQYGTEEYACGWGGYTSRLGQGLVPALGLDLFTFPEPTAYPDGSVVPIGSYHVLADHRSGSVATDWYPAGVPAAFDRGIRNADVKNEFEAGEWTSPAPDGLGRWVWGDSFYNTGAWIDDDAGTRLRHGFIAVGTFYAGRAWYETSTLHCDRRTAEIQVFDPAHLAQAAAGLRPPWSVQPARRIDITAFLREPATPNNLYGCTGNSPAGGASGASFDPITSRLYILSYNAGNGGAQPDSAIYVFQVGGQ